MYVVMNRIPRLGSWGKRGKRGWRESFQEKNSGKVIYEMLENVMGEPLFGWVSLGCGRGDGYGGLVVLSGLALLYISRSYF